MAQQKEPQLFDLLKKDHKTVQEMMSQLEEISMDQREEVFSALQDEFLEHCKLEEKIFYPQLQRIGELKEFAEDALEEHAQAKDLLVQLEDLLEEEDDFDTALQDFKETVQHHIKDEEQKIFRRCTDFISDDQLRDMAQKCLKEKERMHPSSSGGGSKKGKK